LRFVADGMLGTLARWLRMLGHDVEYTNSLDDSQLLATAKEEDRILLTRDFELYQRAIGKEIAAFCMEGKTQEERLAELAKRFGIELKIDMVTSRCPKCNTTVRPISKKEAENRVEQNTFEHYQEFWECPKCGQIYWQGAHWTRIRRTLEMAGEHLKRLRNPR